MNHAPRSSPAELSGANHHLLRERKSSAPSHSSQPTLFTFDSPAGHLQSTLSASAPQDYLFLHQCMSRKSENARYCGEQNARGATVGVGQLNPTWRRAPCSGRPCLSLWRPPDGLQRSLLTSTPCHFFGCEDFWLTGAVRRDGGEAAGAQLAGRERRAWAAASAGFSCRSCLSLPKKNKTSTTKKKGSDN